MQQQGFSDSWRQQTRLTLERKSRHDQGYDSDDSDCSFVSAHSTRSEPALDQAGSPKSMRSRRSLKWLAKSVNYLSGAQCLPSYQRLPNRQELHEFTKVKHEPVVPSSFRGQHRRVASAPGEVVPSKEGEMNVTKVFGCDPPWCKVIVNTKPSDKNVRIVRFVALNVKSLPQDTARLLTEFLGDLLDQSLWPFEFVYDLRAMPVPKPHMVFHLAKWGSEAKRREYFIQRCVGCRIILNPGIMFNVTKATCAAFFKVCPPTCNTYFMTEDSDPGPETHFFPPPKETVEKRERDARKAQKNPQSQSADEARTFETTLSKANPQEPEVHEDVGTPPVPNSWFTSAVQKVCPQSGGPPTCFSFLATPKQARQPSKEGADEMAKLTQTLVHQQKVIEALTKRISALEGTDS